MILTNATTSDSNGYATEIRNTDIRHKCSSAIAEYILTHEGITLFADDETGDVEWGEWVGRYGKRLLFENDQGFVSVCRFASEDDAIDELATIQDQYYIWLCSDEPKDQR